MKNKKILVIDDDQAVCRHFTEVLEAKGCLVDSVHTAADAMTTVAKGEYDMVLLDYFLPDIKGDEFLKATKLPRNTKVLLVTGHLTKEVVNTMFKYGIVGYIAKPVENGELVRNVEFHLKKNAMAYSM